MTTQSGERGSNSESENNLPASGEPSRRSGGLDETQNYTPAPGTSGSDGGLQEEMPKSLGRYEVTKLLGRGGFGAVYLGLDPKLDRQVAIKVPRIRDDVGDIEEAFLKEAQRLAQLRHHGIVSVYDVGVEDGRCYIVSEYLQGQGLDAWLKTNKPTWQQVVHIVASIADALAHAHAQSTIHRDVKPGNVILIEEADGLVPKLVDFGLAISESHALGDQRGMIAGTPAYMSPEQSRGLAHRIDGRTDIYSLGILLYEMLCGRRPFRSKDIAELVRQIREDAPQPPRQLAHGIPPRLEDICLKAIFKREADRYKTAGDMAADLRQLLHEATDSQLTSAASPQASQLTGESSGVISSASAMTTSTARRARDAERRQLTVLICNCDSSDPDEPLASLDPEEQRDLLETFHHVCKDAIHRFGGTIVQSTGQELLVCFGFPTAYEDAPHRAVRTGLRIMDEMKNLNEARQGRKIQLSAWAAIHTGMVVAGETVVGDSADTLSIIGDARNVASRMEALTEPEQILISDATHHLVKGFFVCESQGQHKIKGVSRPIELFQVYEESAVHSRVELVDPANLTPLVGRDMELGIIKDRWEHAEEGMGQVVLLIGDAGLGKSRLVREIKEHLALQNPDLPPPVIEWRCSAYHAGSSLFPATEFFERLLGFTRDDSPHDRLDKLVRHLQEFNLDAPEQIALFASLLSVPPDERCAPIELSPIRQKEQTQALLLEWLREYSAEQAVLFIVEDLHWVDPSTMEFLALHVDQGIHDSVLTLLTFRPEFRTPWTSYGHQTQVALTRLTKRQIGEMIKRKAGTDDVPPEIITQLADRTDGVPLFVEEFTQMVQESGVLAADRKGDDISLALHAIPTSLQDLLAARLDRLASDPDVVQLGATFGREFTYELLNAASDLEEEELQQELAKLVEAELLFQKGRPPTSSYIFKHALIQDAAYNSLLNKKRRQFHKTIANTIETGFAETVETQPELLAHHYTEAGDIGKGLEYWLKAGQRAQLRCAVAEAMSHLQRGLELIKNMDEGPQRDQAELGFQLPMGAVLLQAKGYANDDVGNTFARARELCERLGPEAPLFHVIWGHWVWNVVLSRLDTCLKFANEMVELAEQSQDDGFIMEARFCLGLSLMYAGNPTEARQQLECAFERYDEERCRFHSQFTGQICGPILLSYLALTLWHLGLPDQARQTGQRAVDLAKQLGHPFTTAFVLYHLGWLNHYLRDGKVVARFGRDGHKISHAGGFAIWESLGTFNMGVGKLLQGGLSGKQADEAMQQAHDGLTQYMATGAELHISHCYALLADLFLRQGKIDEAKAELDRGFAASSKSKDVCDLSELQRLQGELALRQSAQNQTEAEASFQAAIETARQQQAKAWELRATISLCRLLQTQNRNAEAHQQLASIHSWFSEGAETPDLVAASELLEELSR